MTDEVKELKCKVCGTQRERVISNEELEERYPVYPPNDKRFFLVANEENMKMWTDLKRLWKCPVCNDVIEISKLRLYMLSRKYRSLTI
jgi:rubredoxin